MCDAPELTGWGRWLSVNIRLKRSLNLNLSRRTERLFLTTPEDGSRLPILRRSSRTKPSPCLKASIFHVARPWPQSRSPWTINRSCCMPVLITTTSTKRSSNWMHTVTKPLICKRFMVLPRRSPMTTGCWPKPYKPTIWWLSMICPQPRRMRSAWRVPGRVTRPCVLPMRQCCWREDYLVPQSAN